VTGVLLDTCAYSAFKRGHAEVTRILQESETVALSAVVLGELLAGFRRGQHRRKNETELRAFLDSPRVMVLGLLEETAARYAAILDSLRRAGTPIPTNDLWIAASAWEHGLRLVTTDRHFEQVPQVALDLLAP